MRLGYERYGFGAQVGAWVTIFFLFNRNAFSNRSSILKMTATVYERDTAPAQELLGIVLI